MPTVRKARGSRAVRGSAKKPPGAKVPPTARSVMTADPETILEQASIREAAALMAELGVRHLPVVDARGKLTGMLSDRDVRTTVGDPTEALRGGGKSWEENTVGDVMAADPIRVELDTPISEIAALLADEKIGAIPVVDDGENPVGIVSYVDLIHYLAKQG